MDAVSGSTRRGSRALGAAPRSAWSLTRTGPAFHTRRSHTLVCKSGVEPIPGSRTVFSDTTYWPKQLIADFSADESDPTAVEARRCDKALPLFDLVLSFEVLEHIPRERHERIFDFMVRHAGGFVVLSVARPRQPGSGHIACRTKKDVRGELERRGLRYLPRTTARLAELTREVMKSTNVLAFAGGR